jgi:hypothetical protein
VTLSEFEATLTAKAPPRELPPLLAALWHEARSDWGEAHRIAQDLEGEEAARVHAYLHRKEGDLENAAYWYRRARRPVATDSLEQEWTRLVRALLIEP